MHAWQVRVSARVCGDAHRVWFGAKVRYVSGPRVRRLLRASLGLLLAGGVNNASGGMIPGAVHQKASSGGPVRLIVQLLATAVPEGELKSLDAVTAQRQRISVTRSAVMDELAGTDYRVVREFEAIPFVALEVGPDAISALKASPRVLAVEEDRLEAFLLSQSIPLIGADKAWAVGLDGTGITVAVLDSGVDKNLPFLSGKVVDEACFSFNASCPNGQTSQLGSGAGAPCAYAPNGCQHGTFVAGIAAGHGTGFSGVAKGAHLISVQLASKASGSSCAGTGEDPCAVVSVSDMIAGLERVLTLKNQYAIAAVNISVGGGKFGSPCDSESPARKAAIDNLRSVGVATVVASGNSGYPDGITAPACVSTAVSVGSTTKSDTVSSFSNSSSSLSLLAPGESITSYTAGGSLAIGTGTSFAAPHVTGAWAILKQKNPAATVDEVLAAMTSTGLPVTDSRNGIAKPRIQVNAALQALGPPPSFSAVTLNRAVFHTAQQITYQATLNPGSTSAQVDIYLGALLPDGATFLSLVEGVQGVFSITLGPAPVPFRTNVTLSQTIIPFTYTFNGSEPAGTYFTYAGFAVAGSNPLNPTTQLSLTTRAFQFAP